MQFQTPNGLDFRSIKNTRGKAISICKSNDIPILENRWWGGTDMGVRFNGKRCKILKSKRQGFVEFAGTISATFTNHNKMSLTSTQKQQDLLVEIESEGLKIKINESTGDLEVISDENSYSKSFLLPYQSDLTNLYVEQILGKHEVSLPDYSYSSAQHSTMLKAFIDHLSGINKRHIEHCPIT